MIKYLKLFSTPIENNIRSKLLLSIIITLILTILEISSIALIIPVISLIVDSNFLTDYKFLKDLFLMFSPIEFFSLSSNNFTINQKLISGSVLIFLIIIFLKFFISIFLVSYNFRISKDINFSISNNLARKNLYQTYEEYLKKNYTDYVVSLLQEVTNVTFFIQEILKAFSEVLIISAILIFLSVTKPIISILVLGIIVFSALLYIKVIKEKALQLGTQRRDNEQLRTNLLNQIFSGFSEIKLRQCENYFLEKYLNNLKNTIIPDMKIQTYSAIPRLWFDVIAATSIVIIIHFLFYTGRSNEEIIANISLFAFISYRLIPSVNKLTNCYQYIKYFKPSAEKILLEIEQKKEFDRNTIQIEKNINLKKLSLINISYKINNKVIFKEINLDLYENKIYGLKGASGAGKTTLCNLILGLIEPSTGSIFYNDKKLFGTNQIKGKISYVPQRIFVLNDTIINNVAFGVKDNLVNDALALKCLQEAELGDLVTERGLDFKISINGINLSVGQVQRLALARCLYFNSSMIILDEATSALDRLNQEKILNLIKKLKKIVLIISHDDQVLKSCDEQFLLENNTLKKY